MFAKLWFTFCLIGLFHIEAIGQQTEALIDELVVRSDPFELCITLLGQDEYDFAPYAADLLPDDIRVSPAFREIVKLGFDAVPVLLEHLNDERVVNRDFPKSYLQSTADEYDFNRATCEKAPEGVNTGKTSFSEVETFTVGDVCFQALGQILNRRWQVSRPQESMGTIVSSPTRSEALRKAILNEWKGLTREEHRAKLIADFERPDSVSRIFFAYRRLAYYYPDSVEPLVLKFLNGPVVARETSREFMEELLGADKEAVAGLVQKFALKHGEHSCYIVQQMLFREINHMNVEEPTEEEIKIRHLLHNAFDWPVDVTYEHWTRLPKTGFTKQEFARVIRCLRYDLSEAIGLRIQEILESQEAFETPADIDLAKACLTSLMSRESHNDYIAEAIKTVDFENDPVWKSLMPMVLKWYEDKKTTERK